jgi:GTPase
MVKGARPRFLYATQTAYAPPTVTVFCSDPQRVAPAYERYLGNQLRAAFDLEGTPLRLRFRPRREQENRKRRKVPSPRRGEG